MPNEQPKNLKEINRLLIENKVKIMDSVITQYVRSSIQILESQGDDITEFTLVQVSTPIHRTVDGLEILTEWRIVAISEIDNPNGGSNE